jgi:FAD/FMN-containing dehydrogenase/Fe-S oxidoreductase
MKATNYREIPYNFTSADDRLIINHLFGPELWDDLEELRSQRVTGRSARLVMRCIGDLFILHRNPFLSQELIDSPRRRFTFFNVMKKDLNIIETTAKKVNVDSERTNKVVNLVRLCRDKAKALHREISSASTTRKTIRKRLGAIIGGDNVCFDPFSLISHATDATDWRLYLPMAVVRPSSEEQIAPLLEAIVDLGLKVIPRGGGTGLTGGAVPVRSGCVMINTEKLNRIQGIISRSFQDDHGTSHEMAVLRLESGVITQDAMQYAEQRGLVFASDPTSAWASTIGGNIAENAGGKTAVLWGTTIDNLLAYTIAMPGQGLVHVRRANHRMRKILPDDLVVYEIFDEREQLIKRVELRGDQIRKKGLWKDITNKALGGLPGVQKEGTDGIITSAEFILYPAYEKKLTFCLEFFGLDMDEASRVIVEISEQFTNQGQEALMALEHFDEEYIRAINYKFKAARSAPPKAVLLIDMVGHTTEQILRGKERLLRLLDRYNNTEIFVASDADEAARFWRDRKRLGAISARTNAFKLNEDIVLPLPALAEFARFVDATNIDEDIYSQQNVVQEILAYLETAEPIEDPDWLEAKIPKADEICTLALQQLATRDVEAIRAETVLKRIEADLLELFRGYKRISANIRRIIEQVRQRRIVIATHMHAGDGNVHVNIPVFSNDRAMMQRAAETADKVMAKAVALGGVVSGEHGIGITKMKFLDPLFIDELSLYRRQIDPRGIMNPGKLVDPDIINKVFTPSFNLLELEARILQHGSLETLASMISKCVRCGKCKADCCVFYPGSNLFFHPRNKNLAIGSLIEALLYDMQRSHFPRFNQLKNLEEIADHCTLCGKCLKPCPVDIDTAQVSILERRILNELGFKHSPLPTRMSLNYLKTRNRLYNSVFRKTVVEWGAGLQRLGAEMLRRAPGIIADKKWRLISMLKAPMMPPSKTTLRDILPACSLNESLLLNPPEPAVKTVFYFPGCGSERLYAEIAEASIYDLLKTGVRVVLPPPHLCCGFPAKANAKVKMHSDVTLRDTIILSQIRDMLGYINFDALIISCGTCREALHELGAEEVFGCDLADIAQFVLELAPDRFTQEKERHFLYHAPCHDSLQGEGLLMVRRIGGKVDGIDGCCSEAGTLALSRPDIAGAMLQRKRDALLTHLKGPATAQTIVTNCPSCISGLGRNRDLGVVPQHLAVLLAESLGGSQWRQELSTLLRKAEVVTF